MVEKLMWVTDGVLVDMEKSKCLARNLLQFHPVDLQHCTNFPEMEPKKPHQCAKNVAMHASPYSDADV